MEVKVKIGDQNISVDGVWKVFSDSLDKDFICKLSTGRNKVTFGLMAKEVEDLLDWVYAANRCESRLVVTGEDKATVVERHIIESVEIGLKIIL